MDLVGSRYVEATYSMVDVLNIRSPEAQGRINTVLYAYNVFRPSRLVCLREKMFDLSSNSPPSRCACCLLRSWSMKSKVALPTDASRSGWFQKPIFAVSEAKLSLMASEAPFALTRHHIITHTYTSNQITVQPRQNCLSLSDPPFTPYSLTRTSWQTRPHTHLLNFFTPSSKFLLIGFLPPLVLYLNPLPSSSITLLLPSWPKVLPNCLFCPLFDKTSRPKVDVLFPPRFPFALF